MAASPSGGRRGREANVPLTRLVSHTFDVEHADALASVLLIEAAGATVSEALDRMPDRYNERLAGATTSPAHNCSWCASTTWRHCTEANRRSKHRARREHAPISSPEEGSSKSATSLRVRRRKAAWLREADVRPRNADTFITRAKDVRSALLAQRPLPWGESLKPELDASGRN